MLKKSLRHVYTLHLPLFPHADVIIDMLGSEEARAAILSYYQASDEPDAVESAIKEVCSTGQESVTSNQVWTQR